MDYCVTVEKYGKIGGAFLGIHGVNVYNESNELSRETSKIIAARKAHQKCNPLAVWLPHKGNFRVQSNSTNFFPPIAAKAHRNTQKQNIYISV